MTTETVNATGRKRGRFIRRLIRLARGRGGVTAVEFALIAPVCMTLVCAFIDLSMVMFITNVMEGGLREASRYAITGYTETGKTREQKIAEIIKDHSYGLIKAEDITITYKVYPSFGDVGKPEPFVDSNNNGQHDAGEPFTDINNNSYCVDSCDSFADPPVDCDPGLSCFASTCEERCDGCTFDCCPISGFTCDAETHECVP